MDLLAPTAFHFDGYDKLLVAAAIRYGHFDAALYRFIDRHTAVLSQRDAAFFGVNLTARKPEKSTRETNPYMKKFLKKSSWKPQKMAVFAGALRYSQYRWWQVRLIQFIMWLTGGSTDRRRDLELTDWERVAVFAHSFFGEPPAGAAVSNTTPQPSGENP